MPEKTNILVSIIIPCYNEEKFIRECIESLLKQKIEGEYEIIVVDGMSTDSTRDILLEIAAANNQVRIFDNIKRITPVSFNMGIKNSHGEFICILGAHSNYDEHYISNCLNLFTRHPEVSCVGGPIISKGKNNFAKAAAIAMSSSVGVGNAKHRFPDYEGYAEMACFPMFRREVFERIGYYDESLVRNQDDEFCFRLRLSGGKIYISPEVKADYYVRESPIKLFEQYYNYGRYRIAVLKKHKLPIALRQFVPAFFFMVVTFLLVIGIITGNSLIATTLPAVYVLTILMASTAVATRKGPAIAINFIAAVFILHTSYAAGFMAGLLGTNKQKQINAPEF